MATRPPSVRAVCDDKDFQDAYDYEVRMGIFTALDACDEQIRNVQKLMFGPPSAWFIFNAVCRGICRDYSTRVARLAQYEALTNCTCMATQAKCPRRAVDMLCTSTGYCYNTTMYEESVCGVSACGRWATNEADYRSARRACGQSLDSGAQTTSAHAAALLVALAAGLVLAWRPN